MDHVTRATPFKGGWVVRRLTLDIAYNHTKFDDGSFSRSEDISGGVTCEIIKLATWPWPRPLRGQLVIWRLVLLMANPCTKFKVCSFSHSEDISWGVKFENCLLDPDHAPFRDDLSPAGWGMLWQIYPPNLKCLSSPVTEIWKAPQNVENGVVWGG